MSEPYDIYLFEDCNDASNLFRFENIPGTLTEGYVYSIVGGTGFTGFAKVITYAEEGPIYSTNGVIFTGGETQCPTPTPTPTPDASPNPTPTPTPTPSSTEEVSFTSFSAPTGCTYSEFCFYTHLPSLSGYSGNYTAGSTYNDAPTYSGDGTSAAVIYYYSSVTETYWCLSTTIGGDCLLKGASPCYSDCPDIAANDFNTGICPTPTPTQVNCSIFDFNAYFDCDWEPLPTPTPSVACDDVNFDVNAIGVTPTPTPTGDICNGVGISFSMSGYTPAVTPTITLTPSVTLTNTVAAGGQVTFNMLDETFSCVSVKVLTDCLSGEEFYVTDGLSFSGVPVVIGMTILVDLNGGYHCVSYTRDDSNFSSNTVVGDIVQLYSVCEYCSIIPTPTPTVTTTPTITPSSSQTPTPSVTASPSVTPSQTATVGTTPPVTPTQTQTPTSSQTPTPSITPSPSATPNYVYVYQSCSPIFPNLVATQMIQTQVVSFANQPGAIFKDTDGYCWTYIDRFDSTYIAPPSVITVTFEGNYFDGSSSQIYSDCTTCETVTIQGTTYNYFNATRCDNGGTVIVKSPYTEPIPITFNTFELGFAGTNTQFIDFNVVIGTIVTVSDPTGDFCCTIDSVSQSQNTNYIVYKPITPIVSCGDCPTYRKYTANACDGSEQNVTIYTSTSVPIYNFAANGGNIVSVTTSSTCYNIVNYDGIVTDYYINSNTTKFVVQGYADCQTCFDAYNSSGSGGGGGGGGGSS